MVGFSHSGWGLKVEGDTLPNYNMPKFDSIGANEYIVDVVHGVCDFISAVDTPIIWEMSIWYHTLNCGYTCRISGETDFPCIYGDRVGLGRVYVKLDKDQPLDFDNWVYGLRDGRSYCSDGLAHLFDFQVNGLGVGETGKDKRPSFLGISQGDALKIKVKADAFRGMALILGTVIPMFRAIRKQNGTISSSLESWEHYCCRLAHARAGSTWLREAPRLPDTARRRALLHC